MSSPTFPEVVRYLLKLYPRIEPDQSAVFLRELHEWLEKWHISTKDVSSTEVEGLTPSQAIAFNKILDFLESGEQFFRFTGYAGTGKSYTIAKLIRHLSEKWDLRVCVASPTNKAVKTLTRMLRDNELSEGNDFVPMTVAKLLGKTAKENTDNGQKTFEKTKEVDFSSFDIIFVDEFSMIGESTLEEITEEVENSPRPVKVIFIGDDAQLPPINEEISPVAIAAMPEARLTEIVRYSGEIVAVAEEIRSEAKYKSTLYRFSTAKDGTIITLPETAWIDTAIESFSSTEWADDPDHCRAIAWKNSTVARINTTFRKRLFGDSVPDYIVGDRLIAKAPILRESELASNGWQVVADNREEFTVISEPVLLRDMATGFDYYSIPSECAHGTICLRVLTEESEERRKTQKNALAREARKRGPNYRNKWREFFDLENSFDNIVHALCLTAHSAQGSSIEKVFLFASEMKFCKEKQQILYTSLTRAKRQCFICQ